MSKGDDIIMATAVTKRKKSFPVEVEEEKN